MSSESILTNILRAMLFVGTCSIVFMVLGMMGSYSIDSSDVQFATLQERISDAIEANVYPVAVNMELSEIITSNADADAEDPLGIRVTIEGAESPLYYNQNYFDANYGSGAGIKANVRSRSANRFLTTTDGKEVLVTIDVVGLRI